MNKILRIILVSALFLPGLTGCLRGRLRTGTPGLATLSPTEAVASSTTVTASPATATIPGASPTLSSPTPSVAPSTTPSLTAVPSLPPTPDPFWQEWQDLSNEFEDWLNSDPTVSPGEIP